MPERSQFRLLAERRFGPFFGVQFLGAMNDNVFKQALLIMLATSLAVYAVAEYSVPVVPAFVLLATAGLLGRYRPVRARTAPSPQG